MHAAPIHTSATIQMIIRATGSTANPRTIAACGSPQARTLARALPSQSCATCVGALVKTAYPAQQDATPAALERWAWTGGHGDEPYEQNTQQSPGFGRSLAPQPVHS